MAIRIVEFDPVHCIGATAHPSQAHYQHMLDDPQSFCEWWSSTYSALADGKLIAIGGWTLIERALGGWVLFTDKITPARFVRIHRTVARRLIFFEQLNDPVFAHLDPDNPQAMRWAGLLGLETQRTDILPDGRRMLRAETYVH